MSEYVVASDGQRILMDAQDAAAFRGERISRLNSKQYCAAGRREALSRTIVKRFRRLRRSECVYCLRGPRDLRRKYLSVMPAHASVLHGECIFQTRAGTYEVRINYRYRRIHTSTHKTRLAAVRCRNRMLRELGYMP